MLSDVVLQGSLLATRCRLAYVLTSSLPAADVAQLGLGRAPADIYGLISVSVPGHSLMVVSMSFCVCVKWPNVYSACYA